MLVVVLFVVLAAQLCAAASWNDVEKLVDQAITLRSFPGAALIVTKYSFGGPYTTLYEKAFGNYTYDVASPPITLDTLFDVASLTKVTSTTTAVAQLYQRHLLSMSDRPCSEHLLGAQFCAPPNQIKANITVQMLMAHCAGFPADPSPGYAERTFGCPETLENPSSPREVFTCQSKIHASLLAQKLATVPGTTELYSDLSMMTMMYIVGRLARTHNLVSSGDLLPACAHALHTRDHTAPVSLPIDQCYFEAYVRLHVVAPLARFGLANPTEALRYVPPAEAQAQCAPTEIDNNYRHRLMQGSVHDENAYASGGVQGHAGLFGSARAVAALMTSIMVADVNTQFPFNYFTRSLFIKAVNSTFSSRALGWDTNLPAGPGPCGSLNPTTFGHTGFTGTLICADPGRQVALVFFTNRVYPSRANNDIRRVRNTLSTLVQQIVDRGEIKSTVA